MKVGMYYSNKDVRIEEMPIPEIGPKDILMKVIACGICGSDIMEWYRIKRAPLVLGHEPAGVVAKVGSEIKKYRPGDRIFSTHHVPCGECRFCLKGHETACETFQAKNNFTPGGFSQYLKISGKSLDTGTLVLPDNMSFDRASFIEPLGTVVRGLRTLELKPAESLVVYGAGVAGLLQIKLAKALGAGRIIAADISDYRLEAAKKFGAEYTINAQTKESIPDFIKKVNGELADKVIICTGSLSASTQALQSVGKGGTVLFFAVPKPEELISIDFNRYWRNSISIKTSYGAAPIDNQQAAELIRAGNIEVDKMITHSLPLEKIALGFKLASEGNSCLKIIIRPNEME